MATVEFAIVGSALMIVLLGCIEVGRALFVWNTLGEATRRGARLAAVCPVNHGAVARAAVLAPPGGSTRSPYLHALSTAQVTTEYLTAAGAPTTLIDDMRFVRVAITGYQHTLLIPFLTPTIDVPPLATTVPVESLGYSPDLDLRECFGEA